MRLFFEMRIWNRFKNIFFVLCALIFTACAVVSKDDTKLEIELVREVSNGKVMGAIMDNGALSWKGIRYATAPTGKLRWRAPVPPEKINEIFDATEFSERCPQIASRLDALEGLDAGKLVGSEDCLSVNIYAPGHSSSETRLPVMFWIHGGSNIRGRSSVYDGSHLAAKYNVVVVTVQYRLGPLGFFAHSDLRKAASTYEDQAANFALLDLVAALKWVRENIEAFNGDSNNVTIFGESAGGMNTFSLLASPLAKGLFHRAIVQSGGATSMSLDVAETIHPYSSEKIAAKLGGIEQARQSSLEDLYRAYDYDENGDYQMPIIIEDGITLAKKPLLTSLADPEFLNRVPTIVGGNRDEIKLWQFVDPELVKSAYKPFWRPEDETFYQVRAQYLSDIWLARGVYHPITAMSAAGNKDLYAYRFDWDGNHQSLLFDFSTLLGAAHGVEIPFVFGDKTVFGPLKYVVFPWHSKNDQDQLREIIQKLWTNFAKSGVPTGHNISQVKWHTWSADNANFLQLDIDDSTKSFPTMLAGLNSVSEIAERLASDEMISEDIKCKVARAIHNWDLDGVKEPVFPLNLNVLCRQSQ